MAMIRPVTSYASSPFTVRSFVFLCTLRTNERETTCVSHSRMYYIMCEHSNDKPSSVLTVRKDVEGCLKTSTASSLLSGHIRRPTASYTARFVVHEGGQECVRLKRLVAALRRLSWGTTDSERLLWDIQCPQKPMSSF